MVQRGTECGAQSAVPQSDFTKPEQTLIIFDWDDTLCPSGWIRQAGLLQPSLVRVHLLDEDIRDLLKRLEQMVSRLLTAAMQLGKVVIVTNAQKPWVEDSCKCFMPGLMSLISKIPVRYARDIHKTELDQQKVVEQKVGGGMVKDVADKFGGIVVDAELKKSAWSQDILKSYIATAWTQLSDILATTQNSSSVLNIHAPRLWKEAAFRQELYNENKVFRNVLSIGDAAYERDALHNVSAALPKQRHCNTKTAKLLDRPSIPDLIKQLSMVHNSISLIVEHDGDVNIEIDDDSLDFDINTIETSV